MNILAIYGSNSGNTKALINFIKLWFKKLKFSFIAYDAKNITQKIDFKAYNLVILSSPTWGGFKPVIQEDFAQFWSTLNLSDIKDTTFAVIGLGDLYYPSFCKAVDFIVDDIVKYGGNLITNSLAIPDNWVDSKSTIEEWLERIQKQLLVAIKS